MTEKTDIAALLLDMRDLAERIVECQGENSDGEEIIHLYDQSDTTFKAENILLVLDALEAERQRADDWKQVVDLRDSEIANLNDKLATPVSLPKAAYFNSSAENLPFFRAFQVIEAIHKVGFLTVTYED